MQLCTVTEQPTLNVSDISQTAQDTFEKRRTTHSGRQDVISLSVLLRYKHYSICQVYSISRVPSFSVRSRVHVLSASGEPGKQERDSHHSWRTNCRGTRTIVQPRGRLNNNHVVGHPFPKNNSEQGRGFDDHAVSQR